MFENPRRGRQTRNFTASVQKILDLKSSSEQIFSQNRRWVPLTYARQKEPTDPGKSLVGLSNFFFFSLGILLTALKKISANNLFVACRHRTHKKNQRRLIDLSKTEKKGYWEACFALSALWLSYCQVSYTWLVCSLDNKHKGKGLWFDFQHLLVGRSVAWRH